MTALQRDNQAYADDFVYVDYGPGHSAEVIPFPFRGQMMLVGDICFQHGERRGRKQKRAYLDEVIGSFRQRMERLGVAPERIDAEVAYVEAIFADNGHQGVA